MTTAQRSVQSADINSVVYTPWRAFIKGGPAITNGMPLYVEILRDRVVRLMAWAQSQPNATQFKTLLGRIQTTASSQDRIQRALSLLEECKALPKKSEIKDLLLDQVQDDLNIAFDESYLLHPKGLENIAPYFNDFVQGFNGLNTQGIKTHRTEAGMTAYYFIATTIAEHNRTKLQAIQPQVQDVNAKLAKEILDQQYVSLLSSANKDNAESVKTALETLAGEYQKIMRNATSIHLIRDLEASLKRCRETTAFMIFVANSTVAQEQLKAMQEKLPKPVKKEISSAFPDTVMLVIYSGLGCLVISAALLVYLIAKKTLQSWGTPIPK